MTGPLKRKAKERFRCCFPIQCRTHRGEPRLPIYTVFVGGAEVNDHLLTWGEAVLLSQSYDAQGYDDIAIVDTNTNEQVEYKK